MLVKSIPGQLDVPSVAFPAPVALVTADTRPAVDVKVKI